MSSNTLIQYLRQLIAQNDLKAVILELSRIFQKSPKLDEVIQQSARYNKVKAQIRAGVVDYQQANLTENQIRVALIELISELEESNKIETINTELNRYANSISGKNIVTGNISAGGNVSIGDQVTHQHESKTSRNLKIFLYVLVPLLAITLAVFFYQYQMNKKPLTYTIHLEDQTSNPHLPFEKGEVFLRYEGEERKKSIDQELIFTGIPGKLRGQKIELSFEAVGFYKIDTLIALKGEGLTLPIYRNNYYGRVYGKIVDSETLVPIPNASVVIDEMKTSTDENGAFSLLIPLAKQRKQQRLRVEHPDFESKTVTEPVLPNEETRIPLQKIN